MTSLTGCNACIFHGSDILSSNYQAMTGPGQLGVLLCFFPEIPRFFFMFFFFVGHADKFLREIAMFMEGSGTTQVVAKSSRKRQPYV